MGLLRVSQVTTHSPIVRRRSSPVATELPAAIVGNCGSLGLPARSSRQTRMTALVVRVGGWRAPLFSSLAVALTCAAPAS